MKNRIRKKRDAKIEAMAAIAVEQKHEAIANQAIEHNRAELERLLRDESAGERAPADVTFIGGARATEAPQDDGRLVGEGVRRREASSVQREASAFFDLAGTIQWFLHEVDIETPKEEDPASIDEAVAFVRRGLTEHARTFNEMRRELEDLRPKATQLATIQSARPMTTPAGDEITGIARVLGLAGVEVKATKVLEVANQLASEGLRVELVAQEARKPAPATPTPAEGSPAEDEGSG